MNDATNILHVLRGYVSGIVLVVLLLCVQHAIASKPRNSKRLKLLPVPGHTRAVIAAAANQHFLATADTKEIHIRDRKSLVPLARTRYPWPIGDILYMKIKEDGLYLVGSFSLLEKKVHYLSLKEVIRGRLSTWKTIPLEKKLYLYLSLQKSQRSQKPRLRSSFDKQLKLTDNNHTACIYKKKRHEKVACFSVASDGPSITCVELIEREQLVLGLSDGTFVLRHLHGTNAASPDGIVGSKREGKSIPLAFSPDGKDLAFRLDTARGTLVGIWELATGRLRKTLGPFGPHCVRNILYSPDGRRLALNLNCFPSKTQHLPGKRVAAFAVIDVKSGRELKLWDKFILVEQSHFVDANTLLLGNRSGDVLRWSLQHQRWIERHKGNYKAAGGLAPNHHSLQLSGKSYAMVDQERTAPLLWTPANRTRQQLANVPKQRMRSLLKFDKLGTQLAVVAWSSLGAKSWIETYNVGSKRFEHQFELPTDVVQSWRQTEHGQNGDIAFSLDGQFLASGGVRGRVAVWNRKYKKIIAKFAPSGGAVSSLAFHPSRPWLAVSTGDGFVRIYNVANQSMIREFVLWSDGEWLVRRPGSPSYVASSGASARACVLEFDGNRWLANSLLGWETSLRVKTLSSQPSMGLPTRPTQRKLCISGHVWQRFQARPNGAIWFTVFLGVLAFLGILFLLSLVKTRMAVSK